MNDIEIALEDLDILVEVARQHMGIAQWLGLVQSALIMKEALEKQEIYEEELEMIYKMADDMALTGNVPSSKEHAEAIRNYLDWVEAGQMVEEVEDE